jgi:sec-independent protein translocase protein TatB
LPCGNDQATVSLKVFGISFTELLVILVVALVVLGPQRLPGMLRTVGLWIHKIRTLSSEVRAQTGIDELLRQEGIAGGIAEVRALLRGDPRILARPIEPRDKGAAGDVNDPYVARSVVDENRERPVEGPDAYGALPDDLVDEEELTAAAGAAEGPGASQAPPLGTVQAPAATETNSPLGAGGSLATRDGVAAATADVNAALPEEPRA